MTDDKEQTLNAINSPIDHLILDNSGYFDGLTVFFIKINNCNQFTQCLSMNIIFQNHTHLSITVRIIYQSDFIWKTESSKKFHSFIAIKA